MLNLLQHEVKNVILLLKWMKRGAIQMVSMMGGIGLIYAVVVAIMCITTFVLFVILAIKGIKALNLYIHDKQNKND
jgi:hypothetical protein